MFHSIIVKAAHGITINLIEVHSYSFQEVGEISRVNCFYVFNIIPFAFSFASINIAEIADLTLNYSNQIRNFQKCMDIIMKLLRDI